MKYFLLVTTTLLSFTIANAQITKSSTNTSTKSLRQKPADHFMFQFANDNWAGAPDSLRTTGFGRSGNAYFMMNFPFKTNPKFSVAIGAGIGSSNIYFDRQQAQISSTAQKLVFQKMDSLNRYKKFKVATTYLEAPVELRWFQNPDDADRSLKVALGVKVGTMLSGYTKGKNLQTKTSAPINEKLVEKIKDKRYFNTTRIALTARIGWGHFSVFGQYQATGVFKENIAPSVRPYSIGITLSGL